MKTIVPTSALTMLFFLCVSTSAETIKATGEAAITGAPSYAREMAYKDALHQISQTHGLAISGQQSMHNGELVDDQLTIESRSNIQRADIIHEESVDGVYRVTVSADVSEIPQCQQASNNYQKSVVVLGFPLLHPEQAMLGNIEDIERELPAVFRQSLLTQSSVSQSTKLSVKTLPTFYGDQLSPSGLIDLARDNDAQYVVTGQMLDVSTGIEENDNFGFLLGRKSLGMTRQFAFEITLFDGFSGQVLSSNQYRTQGQWTMASNQRVGFNSPRFQQMDYGQQVTRLLQQASRDVNKSLACA
ncbi:MAG: flagellar assembly protein T N-terminal domain-containing protein, partial [Oleibacter sp.]|nr:flagellar assembly protein T N-terminal domain-containing protein [Thalassolituus sp.]